MANVLSAPDAPAEICTSLPLPLRVALEETAGRVYGGDSIPLDVQEELETLRAAERTFRSLARSLAGLLVNDGADGVRESGGEFVITAEWRL